MKDIYITSCDKNGGIYRYTLSGDMAELKSKTTLDQPMYSVIHNNKMYVLLREVFPGEISGMCSFDINADGDLINQSRIVPTKGKVACHICVSDDSVYAVNSSSGSVIRFPDTLVVHNGVGINPKRQEMPHTHYVGITPDRKYVCITDLGLDQIFFCDKNLHTCFTASVPKGYGARHLAFSEDGRYIYCVNELVASVTVFCYDGSCAVPCATYSALPDGFDGMNLGAAIRLYKNRLYVSNRGHDSIAVFETEQEKLRLTEFIPTGDHPRDFDIFDDILVCCNMNDDTVTLYSIENHSQLIQTISVKAPLCVNFR